VSQKDTCEELAALQTSTALTQLAELLRLPQPFNICTALGLGRQELRHSELLAYLLDPREPHNLGDRVARALLRRAALLMPITLDVDGLHLDKIEVLREWAHIDILLLSPRDELVMLIENKIDSIEHSNQLKRYYETVVKRYPSWRIIGIYLTPNGIEPIDAHDRDRYVALSYTDVVELLEEVNVELIKPDVATLLRHYADFIRSKLVPDQNSDQARLARKLYRDHHTAIDAIIAARTNRQNIIYNFFNKLLKQVARNSNPMLQADHVGLDARTQTWFTRFAPPTWYQPQLKICDRWTKTRMVVLFQFIQSPQYIGFDLAVGPAPNYTPLRQGFFEIAAVHSPLSQAWRTPEHDWFTIYKRTVLNAETDFFVEFSDGAIKQAINQHWQAFLKDDLPLIINVVDTEILSRDWSSTY
jgi:hypothetical protein